MWGITIPHIFFIYEIVSRIQYYMIKLKFLKGLIKRINSFFEIFSVLLFCLVILSVLTQVVFRYVLRSPLIWIEEVIRIFFIWLVFMGSIVAHNKLLHPRVDMFIEKVSGSSSKKIIGIISDIYVLIFLFFMLVAGSSLAVGLNFISMPTTGLSLLYLYITIPISAAAMIINQVMFLGQKFVQIGRRGVR